MSAAETIVESFAAALLATVARFIPSRDTARAMLDAAYATMEASVDALEAAKLEALERQKKTTP